MHQALATFFAWYTKEKPNFFRTTYSDASTWFKRWVSAYSDWDSAQVLQNEVAFNLSAMGKLEGLLGGFALKDLHIELPLAVVSLKNRAEVVSDLSDYLPVYGSLIVVAFGFVGLPTPLGIKMLLGLMTLGFLIWAVALRIKTRRTVAQTREVVNILELYLRDYLEKKSLRQS